jgi:hypothetical protein
MHTEDSQLAACLTPSSHTPERNTAIIDSETEPESEIQSDNELDYVVENQLGLPEFQWGVVKSSPPPVDDNIICNELNNKSEFFSRRGLQKLTFRLLLAKTGCRAQVSADEGNNSGVMNTDIVLSLGDEVRKTCIVIVQVYKIITEKDKD